MHSWHNQAGQFRSIGSRLVEYTQKSKSRLVDSAADFSPDCSPVAATMQPRRHRSAIGSLNVRIAKKIQLFCDFRLIKCIDCKRRVVSSVVLTEVIVKYQVQINYEWRLPLADVVMMMIKEVESSSTPTHPSRKWPSPPSRPGLC